MKLLDRNRVGLIKDKIRKVRLKWFGHMKRKTQIYLCEAVRGLTLYSRL